MNQKSDYQGKIIDFSKKIKANIYLRVQTKLKLFNATSAEGDPIQGRVTVQVYQITFQFPKCIA
jgi:hypothetical protein